MTGGDNARCQVSALEWLLAARREAAQNPGLIQPLATSRICMRRVPPFWLFDYFADAVIVRPPLISSIYSPAMPEGHLGKFLQTLSIHQDG